MTKDAVGPGIYSATYSNVPVWEYQFGTDLKEHVMRRCEDNYINATHILKAAGFDKPTRTRILEREVQKDTHEKVQGGYGKYQGTWIPLDRGVVLAQRNNVYDRLLPIFEFQVGDETPPPAPKHASKPKAPRPSRPAAGRQAASKPAPPRWNSAAPAHDDYDGADSNMQEDDTPDNLTVASASYMGEDDGFDASHFSTGHRKRKREEDIQNMTEQQHAVYGDELLDYFMLSKNEQPGYRPEPPTNFQPDWQIDRDQNTALHWASAMGDIDIIKQLKRFGANLLARNARGETSLMRAVNFTNCCDRGTFEVVLKELFSTIEAQDHAGQTVLHHTAAMKSGRLTSQKSARYYVEVMLNKLEAEQHPDVIQRLLDMQDNEGNTAIHLAALRGGTKLVRALIGRRASTDIANNEGVRAADLIKELNSTRSKAARQGPQRSSSPFAPDSQRRNPFHDALGDSDINNVSFTSEAASMIHSQVTPAMMSRLQDLGRRYEEEIKEKTEADAEARKVLHNRQFELQGILAQTAELEAQVEADEVAADTSKQAQGLKEKALAFITHQNRITVREEANQELAMMTNGDGANGGAQDDDTPEERLRLAKSLQDGLAQQRYLEGQYVEARGVLGNGDRIDRYRRLIYSCLAHEDHQLLDENLDDLIKMMEEEADMLGREPDQDQLMTL